MPDLECDTKSAYADYDVTMVPRRERHAGEFYNVFREIYKNEKINVIIKRLGELGAEGAELTGSGSAVFGAFSDQMTALSAAKEFPLYFTAVCKAASKGAVALGSI
ncbi:MAG: hypothetical protein K2J80_08650 [Oscillospiraceae bacterium]|nr:hypothetical protein [Oscillospiraceae bacterium]